MCPESQERTHTSAVLARWVSATMIACIAALAACGGGGGGGPPATTTPDQNNPSPGPSDPPSDPSNPPPDTGSRGIQVDLTAGAGGAVSVAADSVAAVMVAGGSSRAFTFSTGDVLRLEAIAAGSAVFAGWTGACAGSGSVCEMAATGSAAATFGSVAKTLAVLADIGGTVDITIGSAALRTVRAGSSATYIVAAESAVALEAEAGDDWRFDSWTMVGEPSCMPAEAVCMLEAGSTSGSATAGFGVVETTLTVTTGAGGSVAVSAGGGEATVASEATFAVDVGSSATLTATALAGYALSAWTLSGRNGSLTCEGADPLPLVCVLPVGSFTADASVSATFEAFATTLTVSTGAGGSVAVSVGGGEATVAPEAAFTVDVGSSATLTAIALAGYALSAWTLSGGNGSLACEGAEPLPEACVLAVGSFTTDTSVSAAFVAVATTLTVTAGAGGSVAVSVGGGAEATVASEAAFVVDVGSSATLTATALAGYALSAWNLSGGHGSLACEGAEPLPEACVLAVGSFTADASVSATFEAVAATLTVTAGAGGSVAVSVGGGDEATVASEAAFAVDVGSSATLTAIALAGYALSAWSLSGGNGSLACQGAEPLPEACVLAVGSFTTDTSVSAAFAAVATTLTVTAGTGGSVAVSVGGGEATVAPEAAFAVDVGSSATLTAIALAGYALSAWTLSGGHGSLACQGAEPLPEACVLPVGSFTADASVSATFEAVAATLTVTAGAGGSAVVSVGGGGEATVASEAAFAVDVGSSATLTAAAIAGYALSAWNLSGGNGSLACEGADPLPEACVLAVGSFTTDTSVSAAFATVATTLTVTAGTGGSVAVSVGDAEATVASEATFAVDVGSSATLTATALAGYALSAWTLSGGNGSLACEGADPLPAVCVLATGSFSADATAAAEFEAFAITLTAIAETGGSAVVSVGGGAEATVASEAAFAVDAESSATLTATALAGYALSAWNLSGGNDSLACEGADPLPAVCVLTVGSFTADASVSAVFEALAATLTVAIGAGGSVAVAAAATEAMVAPKASSAFAVDAGSSATLTAAPLAGYGLSAWILSGGNDSLACQGADPLPAVCVLAVGSFIADARVEATFEAFATTLAVTAGAGGSLEVSVGGGVVKPVASGSGAVFAAGAGSAATLTAIALAGYALSAWNLSGGNGSLACQGADPLPEACVLAAGSFTADATAAAEFEAVATTLTVTAGAGGSVAVSVGGGEETVASGPDSAFAVDVGSSATLTATALAGYALSAWTLSGGNDFLACEGVEPLPEACVLAVGSFSADATAVAAFEAVAAILTVTAGAGGSVAVSVGGGAEETVAPEAAFAVDVGSSATLTATALAGYALSAWNLSGGNGSLACEGVEPLPEACVLPVGSFTADATAAAEFAAFATTLTVTAGAGGSVAVSVGGGAEATVASEAGFAVDAGSSATLTAIPLAGYALSAWTLSGQNGSLACQGAEPLPEACVLAVGSFTTDTSVSAAFVAVAATLTVTAGTGGSVAVSVGGGEATVAPEAAFAVDVGSSATLTATALAGYGLSAWTLSGGNGSLACQGAEPLPEACVLAVGSFSADATAAAEFAAFATTLAVTAGAGGSVAVSVGGGAEATVASEATFAVDAGSSATLTATALAGYGLSAWTLSGGNGSLACQGAEPLPAVCVLAVGSFSADAVAAAAFEAVETSLTLTVEQVEPGGGGPGAVRVSTVPPRRAGLPERYEAGTHIVFLPIGARVALSAEPGDANMFVGWPDGEPLSEAPLTAPCAVLPDGTPDLPDTQRHCEYDADVAHAVTATFEVPRTLSLHISGAPRDAAEALGGAVEVAGPLAVSGPDGAGHYAKSVGVAADRHATFWTRADQFNGADDLELTARPAAGAIFTGWTLDSALSSTTMTGDGLACASGSAGECALRLGLVDASHGLTANFESIREVELNLSQAEGASGAALLVDGIRVDDSGSTLSLLDESFEATAEQSVLRLVGHRDFRVSARAGNNAFFSHWERDADDGAAGGSCLPTDPESVCEFPLLGADIVLHARFKPLATLEIHPLGAPANTVTITGGGRAGETVVAGGDSATLRVAAGESIHLAVTVGDPDSDFLRWEEGCQGSADCALSLPAGSSASVSAQFGLTRTTRLRLGSGASVGVGGAHQGQYTGPLEQAIRVPEGSTLTFSVSAATGAESHVSWEGVCAPAYAADSVHVEPTPVAHIHPIAGGSTCRLTVDAALRDASGEIPVGAVFGTPVALALALVVIDNGSLSAEPFVDVALDGMLFGGVVHRVEALSVAVPSYGIDVLPGTTVTLTVPFYVALAATLFPEAISERLFSWHGDVCDASMNLECRFAVSSAVDALQVTLTLRWPLSIPLAVFGTRQSSPGTLTWNVLDPDVGSGPVSLHSGVLALSAEDLAAGTLERSGTLLALSGSTVQLRVALAPGAAPTWNLPPLPSGAVLSVGAPPSDCSSLSTRHCEMALDGPDFTLMNHRALRVGLPAPIRVPLTLVSPNQYAFGALEWTVAAPDESAEGGYATTTSGMLSANAASWSPSADLSAILVAFRGSSVTLSVSAPDSVEPAWNPAPAPLSSMLPVGAPPSDCSSVATRYCELALDGSGADALNDRALRVSLAAEAFQLRVAVQVNASVAVLTSDPYGANTQTVTVGQGQSTDFLVPPQWRVSVRPDLPANLGALFNGWNSDPFVEAACTLAQPFCEFVAPFGGGSATMRLSDLEFETSPNTLIVYSDWDRDAACTGSVLEVAFHPTGDSVSDIPCQTFMQLIDENVASDSVMRVSALPLVEVLPDRSRRNVPFSHWHWSDGVSRCSQSGRSLNPCIVSLHDALGPYRVILTAVYGDDRTRTPRFDRGAGIEGAGELRLASASTRSLSVGRLGAGAVRAYARSEASAFIESRDSSFFVQLSQDIEDALRPLGLVGEIELASDAGRLDWAVPANGIVTLVADPVVVAEDMRIPGEFLRWEWEGASCHQSDVNPCVVTLTDRVGSMVTAVFRALPAPAVAQRGPGRIALVEGSRVITAVPYAPGALLGWEGDCALDPGRPLECLAPASGTTTVVFHPFVPGIQSVVFGLDYPGLEPHHFQVLFKASASAAFEAVAGLDDISPDDGTARLPVSSALDFPWGAGGALRTEACAAANGPCASPASGEGMLVRSQSIGATGYFKAPNAERIDEFGAAVALSGDGITLAVGAPDEDSASTGSFVPGDVGYQDALDDNSVSEAGAVTIFRRSTETGVWVVDAFVKAPVADTGDAFGDAVALSADGAVLAVGARGENGGLAGANGDALHPPDAGYLDALNDSGATASGAVYLHRRSNGRWTLDAFVKAPAPGQEDAFGAAVALSADGALLAVGAPGEDSASTGTFAPGDGGYQDALDEDSAESAGAVFVYRLSAGRWGLETFFKPPASGADDRFGSSLALAGADAGAMALAAGAPGEDSASTGTFVPGDGGYQDALDDAGADGAGAVSVYRRATPADAWVIDAFVKAPVPGRRAPNPVEGASDAGDAFGETVALAVAADGSMALAVSAANEDSTYTGVFVPGDEDYHRALDSDGLSNVGAVTVYRRSTLTDTWAIEAFVKAPAVGRLDAFGSGMALSADAAVLAVGAPGEDSMFAGVFAPSDADYDDALSDDAANGNDGADSGAVSVYRHSAGSWMVARFVKPPVVSENHFAGDRDFFGDVVALSADGAALAVGAFHDDGAARPGPGNGLSVDPDERVQRAGAVYLY